MKSSIKLILLLVTFFLISCGNEKSKNNETKKEFDSNRQTPKNETIDEFGSRIFKLIQSDNYNSILEYMPDTTEFKSVITNSSLSNQKKEIEINKIENRIKSNIKLLKNSYSKLKQETDKSGIDWTKTNLDFIDFNYIKKNKIEVADIYLNINFKGVNYEIQLKECIKINNTWLIGNEINWVNNDYYYRNEYSDENY
jgi:hypothetical protein